MSELTLYEAIKEVHENESLYEIVPDILEADKIIFTGVGKNAFVAAKTAATFRSLSVPAFYLDATHMLHGDFGAIGNNDIIIALSKSGDTLELYNAMNYLANHFTQAWTIAVSFNPAGKINECTNDFIVLPSVKEQDPWNKVPTNSILVLQYYLDRVAVLAANEKGVKLTDFECNHPGGTIGGIYN